MRRPVRLDSPRRHDASLSLGDGRHRVRRGFCALILLGLLAVGADASAQSIIRERHGHSRPVDISVMAGLPYPFGISPGLRVGIPLAHEGFIPSINDGVFLEPGVHFLYWDDFDDNRTGVMFPILMRWDFYLTRAWTVFGTAGVVFSFFTDDDDRFRVRNGQTIFYGGSRPGFFSVALGAGAMWNFRENMSLRFDASTHMLALGLVFRL
jgi:hypothetical protein